MSVEEFQLVVAKIRPFTDYIYMHVLGEPLLHPHLAEILDFAEAAKLNINITTNGGLLERKKDILLKHSIRQINISLHDAEENITPDKWDTYLKSVLDYAEQAAPKCYVSLRLWNTTHAESAGFNALCLHEIAVRFNLTKDLLNEQTKGNGFKLTEHIFLQRAPRFEWPDDSRVGAQTNKKCFALKDHIAILADGQVIPCCLDADANMKLGNIFSQGLADILQTPRAREINKGFEQRKVVEPLCATCGFIID